MASWSFSFGVSFFFLSTAAFAVPEIDVQQGGASIADGGSDALGDRATGLVIVRPYTVTNQGDTELFLGTGAGVTANGESNCTCTVTAQPTSPVPAAGSTTFTVEVTPTALGVFGCDLMLESSDVDEFPYDVHVGGTGVTPESPAILLSGPVNFVAPEVGEAVVTFWTIANTSSNSPLEVTDVRITGSAAVDFAISGLATLPLAIQPAEQTTLTLTFTPSTAEPVTSMFEAVSDTGGTPGTVTSLELSGSVTTDGTGKVRGGNNFFCAVGSPRAGGGMPLVTGLLLLASCWQNRRRRGGSSS